MINKYNFNNLKPYYELCDDRAGNVKEFVFENPFILPSNITTERINKYHLLVIDQTLSTVFEDNQLDSLKKYLKLSLTNKINSNSIKSLIYAKLIESFNSNFNCDSLLVYFYNGSKINPNKVWISSYKNYYTPNILQFVDHSAKIEEQETDFRVILDTVKNIIKNTQKLDCITFLSDFYHEPDPDLLNADFYNLKQVSGTIKFNLVALWRTKYNGKDSEKREKRQNYFIAKFNEFFQGVVASEKLFIDEYQNSLFTRYGNFLEFEEIITYKPEEPETINYNDSPVISLYAPISNSLKYNEAEVKIKMDTLTKFSWKIKSNFDGNKTFIRFNHNCVRISDRCRLNQWYEGKCDSLGLHIKIDNNLNYDDLKFCYVVEKNGRNIFKECDIKIKKIFIEEQQKTLLFQVLDFFCGLVSLSLIAGFFLFLLLFYELRKSMYRHHLSSLVSWALGIIIIVVLLGFLFCFVFSANYLLFPKILLIIISIIILGKLLCLFLLIPHIIRKLKIYINQNKLQIKGRIRAYTVLLRKKRYILKEKRKLLISKIKKIK